MKKLIKTGPAPKYTFADYPIGHEITLEPLKQSSFKSTLSKFNQPLSPKKRHKYKYEQINFDIIATRIK
jgi:hypothetical protein